MNSIEEAFRAKKEAQEPEADRRYRIIVMLRRADRPKYWSFNCPHCKTPLVELNNYDVYAIDDFFDSTNINNASIGRRCSGKYCRFWFYFAIG